MGDRKITGGMLALLEELDRAAWRAIRSGVRTVILPSALGAGLALCGGCGDSSSPTDSAPPADVRIQQELGLDGGSDSHYPSDSTIDGHQTDSAPSPDQGQIDGPPPPDVGKVDGPPIYPILPPPPPDAGKVDGPPIYPILPPPPPDAGKVDAPPIYPILPPKP